ncbi:uncharacterized protein V6R79_025884 [Siganus canaliculatus]
MKRPFSQKQPEMKETWCVSRNRLKDPAARCEAADVDDHLGRPRSLSQTTSRDLLLPPPGENVCQPVAVNNNTKPPPADDGIPENPEDRGPKRDKEPGQPTTADQVTKPPLADDWTPEKPEDHSPSGDEAPDDKVTNDDVSAPPPEDESPKKTKDQGPNGDSEPDQPTPDDQVPNNKIKPPPADDWTPEKPEDQSPNGDEDPPIHDVTNNDVSPPPADDETPKGPKDKGPQTNDDEILLPPLLQFPFIPPEDPTPKKPKGNDADRKPAPDDNVTKDDVLAPPPDDESPTKPKHQGPNGDNGTIISVIFERDQPTTDDQETNNKTKPPPEDDWTPEKPGGQSPNGDEERDQPTTDDQETKNKTKPPPEDDWTPEKPEDQSPSGDEVKYAGEDFCSDPGLLTMIDTFDRPGRAFSVGKYSNSDAFSAGLENEPGKRIPKAIAYAGAGVGYTRAEWGPFDAEAKGPNAGAGAGASLATGVKAIAKAGLGSASATAGPLKVQAGLAVDTGVGLGPAGVDLKVLGTGVSIGRKMGASVLGTGFEFNLCKLQDLKMSEAAENLGKSISLPDTGLVDMFDNFDRPGHAFADGAYSGADAFAEGFEDKPGKRIPKAGAYAAAGVGYARAEFSVFDAEARGPNASAGVGATVTGVQAMARAELAGASASAGPLKATVGLAADTGVSAGLDGLEVKLLGTGVKIGPEFEISLFGTSIGLDLF